MSIQWTKKSKIVKCSISSKCVPTSGGSGLSSMCVTATTSPIAPSSTSSVAMRHGGDQRPFWFTATLEPAALGLLDDCARGIEVERKRLLREHVLAGFDGARDQLEADLGPVAMSTMSIAGSASSSSRLAKTRPTNGNASLTPRVASGTAS